VGVRPARVAAWRLRRERLTARHPAEALTGHLASIELPRVARRNFDDRFMVDLDP
jgi:hypothetical protein